ncbi:hypothetical protein, partial [Pseudomonas syringae]
WGLAPEKNLEHSIKLQLPAGNVGFMRRLRCTSMNSDVIFSGQQKAESPHKAGFLFASRSSRALKLNMAQRTGRYPPYGSLKNR